MTEKIKATINPVMDMLVKIGMVAILPWSIWITSQAFSCKHFMQRGSRFTIQDGHTLERNITDECRKTRDLIYQIESELSSSFIRKEELEQILNQRRDRE